MMGRRSPGTTLPNSRQQRRTAPDSQAIVWPGGPMRPGSRSLRLGLLGEASQTRRSPEPRPARIESRRRTPVDAYENPGRAAWPLRPAKPDDPETEPRRCAYCLGRFGAEFMPFAEPDLPAGYRRLSKNLRANIARHVPFFRPPSGARLTSPAREWLSRRHWFAPAGR